MRSFTVTLAALISTTLACNPMAQRMHGTHGDAPTPDQPHSSSIQEAPLTEAGIAIPIRDGQTEAWRAAIVELTGPRYAEYESSRKRFGLTSQTTFLQRTPMGDFAVIHLTGPDVHASFHEMSASKDPWDVSWREMTLDLHGMDFAKGAAVMPKVELAFSTQSNDLTGTRPYMFIAPVVDVAAFRALAREITGARRDDYARSRARLGVAREATFLETTGRGAVMVTYWLARDPAASIARLSESNDSFDRWLKTAARDAHRMPLEQLPINANPLVGQYPRPGA